MHRQIAETVFLKENYQLIHRHLFVNRRLSLEWLRFHGAGNVTHFYFEVHLQHLSKIRCPEKQAMDFTEQTRHWCTFICITGICFLAPQIK